MRTVKGLHIVPLLCNKPSLLASAGPYGNKQGATWSLGAQLLPRRLVIVYTEHDHQQEKNANGETRNGKILK